jgi:hypothetical protein
MELIDEPTGGVFEYAATLDLEVICESGTCAARVRLTSDQDLHFDSGLLAADSGKAAAQPAIVLAWTCPYCARENLIEEWLLSEARAPSWPPRMTAAQTDEFPLSLLIPAATRHAVLARYEAGL